MLIAGGAAQMESAPSLVIFAAAFLAITLFCFNFIGDGLRDAPDQKVRLPSSSLWLRGQGALWPLPRALH